MTIQQDLSPLAFARKFRSHRITGGNVLVVYWSGDSEAAAVAEYYSSVRGVPLNQVLVWDSAWTLGSTVHYLDIRPLLEEIFRRLTFTSDANYISNEIFSVLIVGHFPYGMVYPELFGSEISYTDRALMAPYAAGQLSADYSFGQADSSAYPRTFPRWARLDLSGGTQRFNSWAGEFNDSASLREPLIAFWPTDRAGYIAANANRYASTGGDSYSDLLLRAAAVFRIDAPPIVAGDPAGSRYQFMRRIIDDSIAAEEAQYSDFGRVLLNGTPTSNGVAVFPRTDALYLKYPTTSDGYPVGFEWTGLIDEWNDVFPSRPLPTTAPITDHITEGGSYLNPRRTGFTPRSDVFLRVAGLDAYFTGGAPSAAHGLPEKAGDFTYRTGALTVFSQSYGSVPNPEKGVNPWYGTVNPNTLDYTGPVLDEGVPTAAASATLTTTNPNGFSVGILTVQRNLTGCSVGKVQYNTGTRVFRLLEDDVEVLSTTLPVGTVMDLFEHVRSVLPSTWTINVAYPESRVMSALRYGAVFSSGVWEEPGGGADGKAAGLFGALWSGRSLGEWWFMRHYQEKFPQSAWPSGGTVIFYGDPLYRPFGHRIQ